jgi:hypothetical protein
MGLVTHWKSGIGKPFTRWAYMSKSTKLASSWITML